MYKHLRLHNCVGIQESLVANICLRTEPMSDNFINSFRFFSASECASSYYTNILNKPNTTLYHTTDDSVFVTNGLAQQSLKSRNTFPAIHNNVDTSFSREDSSLQTPSC